MEIYETGTGREVMEAIIWKLRTGSPWRRAGRKSRGGLTTKIHMAADAHFIADKGYDSEEIRAEARAAGMIPIIPRRSNSKKPNPEFDAHLYRQRHVVENLFARLKHVREIATRYEKLARNYKSMVYIACSIIWLKLGK